MIRNLQKEQLQKIVDFIKDNYEAPDFLIPESVQLLVHEHGDSEIVILEDEYGIEGVTFFKFLSPLLVEKYRTVVRLDVRGAGISKKLDDTVENLAYTAGAKKIKTNIYANNLPSIFGRLKRGYLIEGLLRNHDGPGMHEYILGKEL